MANLDNRKRSFSSREPKHAFKICQNCQDNLFSTRDFNNYIQLLRYEIQNSFFLKYSWQSAFAHKARVLLKAERKKMEEWKKIEGFDDYSVNRLGGVRNDRRDRYLTFKVNQYGVVYVGLMKDGVQRQRSVALLVAQAYIPQPSPPFDTPINLNGDRYDNRVENLVWRPRWFAVKYNRQFKEPYQNPILEPIVEIETGRKFLNSFDCATQLGVLEQDLVLSIMNRTFVWPMYKQYGILSK